MHPSHCLLLAFVAALSGCADGELPSTTFDQLNAAGQYELLSLDPRGGHTGPDTFHGYKILGKTPVADPATRRKLGDALRRGDRENNDTAAGCFNPRHGIHAASPGKTLDLVICFECYQAQVYENGQRQAGLLLSPSPQKTFDEALRAAGVRRSAGGD